MENKPHFSVYKLSKQLVNSKNHILAGGSGENSLGSPCFVLPLCCFPPGSPAEHLTEQNFVLQGLAKVFLKGYEVQCFLKKELKIFCAQRIMAPRVHFIHLDLFQCIRGKTKSYNARNLERNIL